MKKLNREEVVKIIVGKLQSTGIKFKIDDVDDLIDIVRFALTQYASKGFKLIEKISDRTEFDDSTSSIIILKELVVDALIESKTITTISQINKCKAVFNPVLLDELYLLQVEDKMCISYELKNNEFNFVILNINTGKIYKIPTEKTVDVVVKAMNLLSVMHNVKDAHKHTRMEITYYDCTMNLSTGKFENKLVTESIPISKIELVAILSLNNMYHESLLVTECEDSENGEDFVNEIYNDVIIQSRDLDTQIIKSSPLYKPNDRIVTSKNKRESTDEVIRKLFDDSKDENKFSNTPKKFGDTDEDDGYTSV